MGIWKLRLSMLATLTLIIAVTTLAATAILSYIGAFSTPALFIVVFIFNFIQWLFAPYMIEAIYGAKEVSPGEAPRIHRIFDTIVAKAKIRKPKVMMADVDLPNAFAYGSPLTGSRVAITKGLLERLEEEEVEAVIGHELGHLKHRDVQLMMFLSVLPALFYYIAQSVFWSSMWQGGRNRSNGSALAIVGMLSFAVYFLLNLLVLGASRLREYYADQHAIQVVDDGARKLAEGLAKIVQATGRLRASERGTGSSHSFKALFIADPDSTAQVYGRTDRDLVEAVASQKLSFGDRLLELFSTHPNVTRRIRTLLGRPS